MGWFTRWLCAQPPLVDADAVQVDEHGEAINPHLASALAQTAEAAKDKAFIAARSELLKDIHYAARRGETHLTLFGHLGNAAAFANLGYLRLSGFRTIKDGRSAVRICWGPEAPIEEPYTGCELPPDPWPHTPRPRPMP
jgi:hypothetical protein